mgnify:CR=1 FL=1
MRTLGRSGALALLALGMLFWAGNWVVGRALRETFDPLTRTFWRWTVAAAVETIRKLNLHRRPEFGGSVTQEGALPHAYCCFTQCFRKEAGACCSST